MLPPPVSVLISVLGPLVIPHLRVGQTDTPRAHPLSWPALWQAAVSTKNHLWEFAPAPPDTWSIPIFASLSPNEFII